MKRTALAILSITLFPGAAAATEAAMGRYIPGVFAMPDAGVVPPMPGVYWSANTIYYKGDISADIQVPVAGDIVLGLDALIVGETFTGLWVPEVSLGNNTVLGLSLSIPVQYVEVSASLGGAEVTQRQTALGDIMFAPTIGWHSGTTFLSGSLRVYAPTGAWEEGALDNVGMNYWTFSPTVAFTHLDMQHGLDFSFTAGIDINTTNPDTDYHSGTMAHLDASVMKAFNEQFSAGIFGSVLYQLEDDDGAPPVLDGFKGRSFAIGPMLKYTAGTKENPVNISFSWAPEFSVKNRTQGNGLYLAVSGKF